MVRQKVASELDSVLFGGPALEHVFRKAALLNTLSELVNIREMAKLLIECNFIGKLYREYVRTVRAYGSGKEGALTPAVYLTKIYIPFFLQPLSVLQELNIAFHHNKKLAKPSRRPLNALLLNDDAVNAQLVPTDIFKKHKFKSDWPFARDHPKKHPRHNHFEP